VRSAGGVSSWCAPEDMGCSCPPLLLLRLLAALVVLALGAGRAVGALGHAHSILGLGRATPARLRGRDPVLILLRDRGIARMRVVRGPGAVAALHRGHAAGIFLRRGDRVGVRVDDNGLLAVAANGLAERVGDAIGAPCTRSKTQESQHAQKLHLHPPCPGWLNGSCGKHRRMITREAATRVAIVPVYLLGAMDACWRISAAQQKLDRVHCLLRRPRRPLRACAASQLRNRTPVDRAVRSRTCDQDHRGDLMNARSSFGLLVALVAASCAVPVAAQQITGVPGSPGATTTIDGKQLPPPPEKFGGVIKDSYLNSTPYWPARVVPPKGAPNVLLIMTDDQG